MENTTKGDSQAFSMTDGTDTWENGLSKREYFAGLALQGIMASAVQDTPENIAEGAVRMANELIKALNR